ncbi:MAG: aldo/keto reductase [Candidatus Micrarchaeota archaeon]|nr:aldo/keto reductase [Candidatus Micrarchaeota archaeon]
MIKRLSGKRVFPIGLGTWGMGGWMLPDTGDDRSQIDAIRFALQSGINAIDTAELYGRGHAEELVAQAIKGSDRESIHITSKVWPTHLSRKGIMNAVTKSLERLQTKYLDLYLIHFPNPVANMKEAIGTMEELVDIGKIRSFGVSNFLVGDMIKALEAAKKYEIEANQIEYNVLDKGPERELIPFCEKNKVKVISYTPLAKGSVAKSGELLEVAERYGKTPIQVALNYLLRNSLPIPMSADRGHITEIIGGAGWKLKDADYEFLRKL